MTSGEAGSRSARHAPHLGPSHRLLGRFHVTGVIWYQLPYWVFTRVPLWIESTLVLVFTTLFFLTLGRIRGAIASNLDPVLGPAGRMRRWPRSFRTMRAFAWNLTEKYRRLASPGLFRSTSQGDEHWREALASGRGVILVTAHIGPWEAASQYGASEARRRTHVVREKEIDPRAQAFMERVLARAGAEYVTHFAGDDLKLSFELAEALKLGEIVALQGDRPRQGGRCVNATLFGKPMPLPVGPALLARATGVPILPVFNFRERRFVTRSVIRPPIEVARTADREADVNEAVHRIATEIEWAIRQHPEQWFCFRKLWD